VAEQQPRTEIRFLGIDPEVDVRATDAAMEVCRQHGPTAARMILALKKQGKLS
jgi:hypothetical protein